MTGRAIFFSGPIGVGKSTLGRAVAVALEAIFIDGDDYADHAMPWYGSSLGTSRRIAAATLAALVRSQIAIVAYPLRCINFVYFQRRITDAGYRTTFVSLRASAESILSPGRGRSLAPDERQRAEEMIAQGYGNRPFSDLVVDTDTASFCETVETLVAELRDR